MTEAVPILGDVNPDKVFRTCNGVIIRNLSELRNYLHGCSAYDFRYHVNQDHFKNDFAIWVREVTLDEKLARDLDGELDQKSYERKVALRLKELENAF